VLSSITVFERWLLSFMGITCTSVKYHRVGALCYCVCQCFCHAVIGCLVLQISCWYGAGVFLSW
jgi:hypothetical protein